MRFFDLHCDTITECAKRGKSLTDNDMHISLKRGECFDKWVQTFAIWIPDEYRGQAAWDYFLKNYDFYRQTDVAFCETANELDDALTGNRCAAVLAVEGGAVLMGQLEKVQELYDRGVRMITLTWNGENELAVGCQAGNAPLKPFGREVVREMAKRRMAVDVSHLCRKGFYEVLEQTDGPVLATHSTCADLLETMREPSLDRTYCVRRALTDDQIRALSQHGGIVGLNFCSRFLGGADMGNMDAALRHAYRFLELGGEDFLAMGSDFDGCGIHPDLDGIEKVPNLYTYFVEKGLGTALCDKIFFNNAFQFVKNVL